MEAEEEKERLSEIFERRQIKYMLGKRVSKDVYSEDGRLVISQGDTITDDVIKAAKASNFRSLRLNSFKSPCVSIPYTTVLGIV